MSIIKRGPFKVPKLTEEHPLYWRLLAREAEKLASFLIFLKTKDFLFFQILVASTKVQTLLHTPF